MILGEEMFASLFEFKLKKNLHKKIGSIEEKLLFLNKTNF